MFHKQLNLTIFVHIQRMKYFSILIESFSYIGNFMQKNIRNNIELQKMFANNILPTLSMPPPPLTLIHKEAFFQEKNFSFHAKNHHSHTGRFFFHLSLNIHSLTETKYSLLPNQLFSLTKAYFALRNKVLSNRKRTFRNAEPKIK